MDALIGTEEGAVDGELSGDHVDKKREEQEKKQDGTSTLSLKSRNIQGRGNNM